jgi:hypothetical protein
VTIPDTVEGLPVTDIGPYAFYGNTDLTGDGSFGVQSNQFGFNITASSELTVVVEASASLTDPTWAAVGTNTLAGGTAYFTDPQWMNHPARFYRLRSP